MLTEFLSFIVTSRIKKKTKIKKEKDKTKIMILMKIVYTHKIRKLYES